MTSQGVENPAINASDLLVDFRRVSWTKDSIFVRWQIAEGVQTEELSTNGVAGYELRWEALGSTVVQFSHPLEPDCVEYDIRKLHENTDYEVCVHVLSTSSTTSNSSILSRHCLRASTATDSLHVALGSTFGAFLALGIIVLFVFMAKWQHNRKLKRKLQQTAPSSADSYDSMVQVGELSDVSRAEVVAITNGRAVQYDGGGTHALIVVTSRRLSLAGGEEDKASQAIGGATKPLYEEQHNTEPLPPSPDNHRESRSSRHHQQSNPTEEPGQNHHWESPIESIELDVTAAGHNHQPDVRPKDVRPKDVRPKDLHPKESRRKSLKSRDTKPRIQPEPISNDSQNEDSTLLVHKNASHLTTTNGKKSCQNANIRPNLSW